MKFRYRLFLGLMMFIFGQTVFSMQPKKVIKQSEKLQSLTAEPTELSKEYIPKEVQATIAGFMLKPFVQYLEQSNFIKEQAIKTGTLTFSMDFSPDGLQLVTGGEGTDGAEVWDIKTGKKLRTLLFGGGGSTSNVAFSPDGSKIAVVSTEHTIRIFNINNLQESLEIDMYHGYRLAFSPDGLKLAVGFEDEQANPLVFQLPGGDGLQFDYGANIEEDITIEALAFSPDGTKFVVADRNEEENRHNIKIFSVSGNNFTLLRTLDFYGEDIAFSSDSSLLAIANDAAIRILDTKNGQFLSNLDLGRGNSVAWSPKGIIAVASSNQVNLFLLKSQTNGYKVLSFQSLPIRNSRHVRFSRDGSVLAVEDGPDIQIWRQLILPEQKEKLLNWLKYDARIEQAKVILNIYNARLAGKTEVMLSVDDLFDLTRFMPQDLLKILIDSLGIKLRRSAEVQQLIMQYRQPKQRTRKRKTTSGESPAKRVKVQSETLSPKELAELDEIDKFLGLGQYAPVVIQEEKLEKFQQESTVGESFMPIQGLVPEEEQFFYETLGVRPPQRTRKRSGKPIAPSAKRVKVQKQKKQKLTPQEEQQRMEEARARYLRQKKEEELKKNL